MDRFMVYLELELTKVGDRLWYEIDCGMPRIGLRFLV